VFLHVGGDVVVRMGEVVAILDQRAAEASATRELLGFRRSQGRVVHVAGGQPKSLVICTERIFLSPISAGTLRRRVGLLDELGAISED
jgi:hypothetical protein